MSTTQRKIKDSRAQQKKEEKNGAVRMGKMLLAKVLGSETGCTCNQVTGDLIGALIIQRILNEIEMVTLLTLFQELLSFLNSLSC